MNTTSGRADSNYYSFGELVDFCSRFYEANTEKWRRENVLKRRGALCGFITKFHKDCGVLTSNIQRAMEDLKEDTCIVLMTAHQPNLFPYSGVFRKATLNFALARQLEKRLGVRVISFFGIADQDFTDDRWVKCFQLPAVTRREGVLTPNIKLPEKIMLNRVPKPALNCLNHWKGEIERWLNSTVNSVDRLSKTLGHPMLGSQKGVLQGNFRAFWEMVEEAYECSETYSDFNAFVMSKIVNEAWGYDTLFSSFSECQQIFAQEFNYLLSHFKDYSGSLRDANEKVVERGRGLGISDQEPTLAPFWYHCDCGGKIKLVVVEVNGSLVGCGECVGCERKVKLDFGTVEKPDISRIASRISARAVPMTLVFFKGLGVCCYVGGLGAVNYLRVARHVANELTIPFPPTPVWRPHDHYLGISQMEARLKFKMLSGSFNVPRDHPKAVNRLRSQIAQLRGDLDQLEALKQSIVERLRRREGNETKLKEEIRRISIRQSKLKGSSNLSVLIHELKILENVPAVLSLIPSIIDYAINIGLKETSDQWVEYLISNGRFSSTVHLKSTLTRSNMGCCNTGYYFTK